MKYIRSYKVCGQEVKVFETETLDEDTVGEYRSRSGNIYLEKDDEFVEFHELFHAIWDKYGLNHSALRHYVEEDNWNKFEEDLNSTLGSAIYATLKENKLYK